MRRRRRPAFATAAKRLNQQRMDRCDSAAPRRSGPDRLVFSGLTALFFPGQSVPLRLGLPTVYLLACPSRAQRAKAKGQEGALQENMDGRVKGENVTRTS